MPNLELHQRVVALADLRRARDAKATDLAEKRAWFDAEYAPLIGEFKQASAAVDAAEIALKAVAIDQYLVTKDKALSPGVTVKEFDVLQYDADAAFAWAKETKMALVPESLDKKAFEKIAKASPGIAGSHIVVEPRVTLATDLDKALASATEMV